jgi:hypothetical protein
MKPKLYLHIGRPKTGSTALQSFLYRNREVLARQGVCYPETGRYQRASHKLSLVYLPKLADSEAVKGISADKLYADLATEILNSGLGTAVISSEHFWLMNPKDIPASLREQFDIKIVAYVRRQDEVLVSSFIQEVKGGNLSIDIDLNDYISDNGRLNLLDYDQVLQRWAGVFGQQNIQVRLYETLAEQHGIERDLLQLIGVASVTDLIFSDIRRNVSPPLEVLRLIEELEGLDLDVFSKRRLIALFSKASHVLDDGEGTSATALFTLAQRQRVLSNFADSNSRLGQTFLDQPGSPFPEISAATAITTQTNAAGTLGTEQKIRLLTATIAEQQRQLEMLQNRLVRAEQALGVDGGSRRREPQTNVGNSLLVKLKRLLGRKCR